MFEVSCTCGRTISVNGGQAGAIVNCSCGQQVTVPSLRELREATSSAGRSIAVAPEQQDWRLWWLGVGLLLGGELLQLTGWGILGFSNSTTTHAVLGGMALVHWFYLFARRIALGGAWKRLCDVVLLVVILLYSLWTVCYTLHSRKRI
jgi:hypothetical protein